MPALSKVTIVALLILNALSLHVLADVRSDYMLNCQGCHLPGGEGVDGKVPSFKLLRSFMEVPGGREFLIQVPGTAQSALPDARIAKLLNWMLVSLGGLMPDEFEPYTEDEVADLRTRRIVDVIKVRRALVSQFPE